MWFFIISIPNTGVLSDGNKTKLAKALPIFVIT